MDRKVKTMIEYWNKIFDEIQAYLKVNNSINNIIIAGDYNQSIVSNEIKQFYKDIGV